MNPRTPLRVYLYRLSLIFALIALILVVSLVRMIFLPLGAGTTGLSAVHGRVPPVPMLTIDRTARMIGTVHAATLISYTNNSFEPRQVQARVGDTVTFTNVSSGPMWVVADGSGDSCDATAFGTCEALPPGEYWEYTFTKPGTYGFHSKDNANVNGVIFVQ